MAQRQQPPPQQRAVFADVPGGSATSKALSFDPAMVLACNAQGVPPNRPDLAALMPMSQHAQPIINAVNAHIASDLYQQRGGARVAQERRLTNDETKAVIAFTIDYPPFYRWLNGWMNAGAEARAAPAFLQFLGPIAALFMRALEKLEIMHVPASRGMLVGAIASLQDVYENHEQRLRRGEQLNFWNFASFTRGTEIAARFAGGPGERAIVYLCGDLACVSLQPFSAIPHDEEEVMPIAPLRLVVQSHTMRDNGKLVIGVRQVDEEASVGYYVEPRAAAAGVGGGAGAGVGAVSAEEHQRALREQEERLRAEQEQAHQQQQQQQQQAHQQQQQRLEARIRELEAAVAAAGRGAGRGAAAQPAPAPARDRERAIEWRSRGGSLPSITATVRVGDRDYTKIDCYVESALADDSFPNAWSFLGAYLNQTGGTVTINGRVYNSDQCWQRRDELRAAENAAGKK